MTTDSSSKPARLASLDKDYQRFGIERGSAQPFEDGRHTHGGAGTFEWWYTDVTFDDGTAVVVIFFTKDYFDVPGKARATVDFEIVDPNGKRTNVWTKARKGTLLNAAEDICDVKMETNYIRYEDDGSYHVHYEDHGYVYDAVMKPSAPMWRPETGHWLYGEGADEKDYGWFVALPEASVDATLTYGGKTRTFKNGRGYHDHNWGNVSLEKLMNHWYWGRSHVGPYNVIACDIIAEEEYGNKRFPVFYLAKDGRVLSDDASRTRVERGETHLHPTSGKFMDDDLTYTQVEDDGTIYVVRFHRTGDYNRRSMLEVVPAWKRMLAKAAGLNPTYIRVKGDVSIEVIKDGRSEKVEDTGLWEQYFMGSNKLATIEGVTIPLS